MAQAACFRLAVVMDPIAQIKIRKDSTFALLLEAQRRHWPITYLEPGDLYQQQGRTFVQGQALQVRDDPTDWFTLGECIEQPLDQYDMVLMRQDPPVDAEYLYATHLLQQAADAGSLVMNHPRGLREINEKLVIQRFPELTVPNLVSCNMERHLAFIEQYQDVILKPLDGMGGASVFRVRQDDPNRRVILETLTARGRYSIMAQAFIPDIVHSGDKRILVIDGEPVPYALARLPAAGETRANLAAGGYGKGVALNERDRDIVATVAPFLREYGIVFAGLDVIGDYLTEINVTSPTCIRELDAAYDLNIAGQLLDCLSAKLASA
ncbi:MAG: glutathione synthase [Pseudomonadota bacterium]